MSSPKQSPTRSANKSKTPTSSPTKSSPSKAPKQNGKQKSAHVSPMPEMDMERIDTRHDIILDSLVPPPVDRPVRIYSDGIWDLFHYGHARALEQAKKIFPNVYLIVGVCNDEITHRKKGKTVMTDKERAMALRHCKWVDEVVEDAPWIIDQDFLDLHKIDYVAHDSIPYSSGDVADVYAFVKAQGRFIPTKRTEGVSTSDLITRIVKDYDAYVRRNLERGVSAKELGIGFFKEKEIKTKTAISQFSKSLSQKLHESEETIKTNWTETKNEMPKPVRDMVEFWEDVSNDVIERFVGIFTGEKFSKLFKKRKNEDTASSSAPSSPERSDRPDREAASSPQSGIGEGYEKRGDKRFKMF